VRSQGGEGREGEVSAVIGTITWGELGCPDEPGTVTARGMMLKIEERHIKAASGERHATFNVLEFRPKNGPAQHALGLRVEPDPGAMGRRR
jgi:hypothetical protein